MIDPTDNKTADLVVMAETQRNLQTVVATYGNNLPYSYDRVLNECAFFMEQSAIAALELGKRLVLLKEMEGHGNFGKAVEQLGISDRTARQVMQAALKFSNRQTSADLLQQVKSRSKLFELMILDDGDIKELSEGGTVAGLKLDDVDRMSVRELRAALRESRETITSKDSVMKAKDAKLNDMEEKIDTLSRKVAEKDRQKALEKPTPEAEGQRLRNEVTGIVAAIEIDGIIKQLQQGFTALQAHTVKTNIDHGAYMAGCLNQIKRAIVQVQNEFNLYLEDETPTPYWDSIEAERETEAAIQALNIDWSVIEGTGNGETNH